MGITSGDLPAVLDEIAHHARQNADVRARLRKALFYPLMSGIGIALIGLVMFFWIGPMAEEVSLKGVLAQMWMPGQRAPTSWVGYVPWIFLCMASLGILALIGWVWFRDPLDGGVGTRSIRFRIPFIGRLRAYAAKASFAATMAMLLGRRMPLPESLQLAAAATDDPDVAAQINEMRASAESGESLTASIDATEFLSPTMMWFVETGEATGAPERSLEDVAHVYQQRLDRGVDRLSFFVQPLALLLLGLVVLGFAMVTLLPMYQGFSMFWGG